MKNLTRYDLKYSKWDDQEIIGIGRKKEGRFVKFEDVKEFLPSASDNKHKGVNYDNR